MSPPYIQSMMKYEDMDNNRYGYKNKKYYVQGLDGFIELDN